jgi:hypothetical protein
MRIISDQKDTGRYIINVLLFAFLGFFLVSCAWSTRNSLSEETSGMNNQLVVLNLEKALADQAGSTWAYDAARAVGALQGIVNREDPQLFVVYLDNRMAAEKGLPLEQPGVSRFWLNWIKENSDFLDGYSIGETSDLWSVLQKFSGSLNGLVVWDEDVPATANVASTLAGVENILPVRGSEEPGSFLVQLRNRLPHLEVKRDLRGMFTGQGVIPGTEVNSSGSAKCDAYLWAVEKLLKSGRCSSTHLAYYLDGIRWNRVVPRLKHPYPDLGNAGVLNADYWISRKAFFFDLSPWEDEPASDDPTQPIGADGRTLKTILRTANRVNACSEMILVGGFVPWWLKYCRANWRGYTCQSCRHESVETEWRFVDVLSAYNAMLDADAYGLAGLENASVYRHYPLKEKYDQPGIKSASEVTYDPESIYVCFAMLDYDASAWLTQMYQAVWSDPAREQLPLLWGLNPVLAERVPMVFDAVFRQRPAEDIIGADEGLGYVNYMLLSGDRKYSDLPDARRIYLQQAKEAYERFSMTTTAFVITGHEGVAGEEVLELLGDLSPAGVGFQMGGRVKDGAHHGTRFVSANDDWPFHLSAQDMADSLKEACREEGPGGFVYMRCILARPSQLVEALDLFKKQSPGIQLEVCDAQTFFALVEKAEQLKR